MLRHENSSSSNWSLVYWIVGCSILWFLGVALIYGFNESSVRMNIRWSARFSLINFCLAFGASAFHKIINNHPSKWLLINRKYLGVSFAIIHIVHLFFLLILSYSFHQLFTPEAIVEISLGGLAYFFTVLMLLTSFSFFSNLISSSQWNLLHRMGGYWILIVFSNSILGRIYSGNIEYLPLGILVISVLIFRLVAWNKKVEA